MRLVPYAGYEPSRGVWLKDKRRPRAYLMFKTGRDTLEIAEALNVPEARVLEWITIERSNFRGEPCPYERTARAA